jgi:hypothetical protein
VNPYLVKVSAAEDVNVSWKAKLVTLLEVKQQILAVWGPLFELFFFVVVSHLSLGQRAEDRAPDYNFGVKIQKCSNLKTVPNCTMLCRWRIDMKVGRILRGYASIIYIIYAEKCTWLKGTYVITPFKQMTIFAQQWHYLILRIGMQFCLT